MILPTVTFMTTDSLRAVPRYYREASFAMGSHSLADYLACDLEGGPFWYFHCSGLWDGACLCEALAIQMVVGNSAVIPTS